MREEGRRKKDGLGEGRGGEKETDLVRGGGENTVLFPRIIFHSILDGNEKTHPKNVSRLTLPARSTDDSSYLSYPCQ